MRIELSVIEKIEQYLMGTLSNQEKADFESKLKQDSNLKTQVDVQSQIMEGIQHLALKNATQNAYKSYKLKSLLTKALVVGIIAAAATYGVMKFVEDKEENPTPTEYNETQTQIIFPENDSLSADANNYLEQEIFKIKTDHDTIIETKDGIVIYVPADAFDTSEPEVDLLIQGAVKTEDILMAGLSTITADGQELETGGMFYVDAFVNGNRVDLKKELTVDVPSGEPKAGMKLYDGEKDANGEIVWNNPKPLESFLNPVEITTLDFYPPDYEASLNEMGYSDKVFIDSLYYSFACDNASKYHEDCLKFHTQYGIPDRHLTAEERDFIYNDNRPIDRNITLKEMVILCENGFREMAHFSTNKDSVTEWTNLGLDTSWNSLVSCQGINPASIKTIWNSEFNNTNLATKEFEERIPWIHKSCNNKVLELYINNLDKKLSTVDSMALNYLSGEVLEKFKYFAARNDGRVELDNKASQKMAAYYEKQRKAIAQALAETQENYWNHQYAADNKNNQAQTESGNRNFENTEDVFQKEYKKNLCKVFDELELNKDCNAPVPPNTITVQVANLGWKNIDRLVYEATVARETTTFSENGKTSTLTYTEWSATVSEFEKYDRINVYNIPVEFNSYVKLIGTSGKYEYKLNADLNYQTVVLAWTADGIYFYKSDAITGNSNITLRKVSDIEWRNEIKKSLSSITNMNSELDYTEFMQKDQKRINTNQEKTLLRQKIEPVVFPCGGEVLEMVDSTEAVQITNVIAPH